MPAKKKKVSLRGVLGQKKVATKERFREQKERNQYCIDAVLVDEVLKSLPNNITIIGARVRVGSPFKREKAIVPNKLRRFGCNYMIHSLPSTEAVITVDQVKPSTITTAIKKVAEYIHADPSKATFKYITLSNGTATGKFERTTKDIRLDEKDLRKKANVLGLKEGQGKITSLIADLHAKNFRCSWEEVTVRIVTCHTS